MFDFGILTTPIILAAAIFGFTMVTDTNEIVFDPIHVPKVLEEKGYSADVVTRSLATALKEIDRKAASYRGTVYSPDGNEEKSIELISDYFELNRPVRILQKSLGLVPVQISGHVIQSSDGLFHLDAHASVKGRGVEVEKSGTFEQLDSMIKEAGKDLMWGIDPYIVMLYEYRLEAPSKQFPKTMVALERCLMVCKDSDLPWAQVVWGLMLFNEGKAEESIAKYRKAIELNPQLTRPRYLWGVNLESRGLHDEAIAKFGEVITMDGGYAPAYAGWARSLAAKGEVARAQEMFATSLVHDPRLVEGIVGWARLDAAQGRTADAVAKFRRAVELSPGNAAYQEELRTLLRSVEPDLPAIGASS